MSTYTWAEFKAAVLGFLTDRTPTNDTFAVAAQEYVRARIALNLLGSRDDYVLLERRYTQLRKALCGYNTTANDATLRAAVKLLLRDTKAGDVMFVEAVANFVRAQVEKDGNHGAGYAALRLKLAGYQTTLNDAALQTAVRVRLSDGPRTNAEVARAVALYVRAELAREIDARDEPAQAAASLSESFRRDYQRARVRLAGFNHTLGGGLATEVAKYLPLDAQRTNTATIITALTANAVEDLQAFGTWLNDQIATAKEDLQGLDDWLNAEIDAAKKDIQAMNEKVQKEIRAGAIDLQRLIRAYQIGQVDTLLEADVTEEGFASLGLLENQQVRSARILISRSATEEIEAAQATVTPTANVPRSLVTDETRVYSVVVAPHPDNATPVLIGYDTDTPLAEAPLALGPLRGAIYDLSKVVVKTQTAGDKVNYFAVLAPESDDYEEKRCQSVSWDDARDAMVVQDTCAPQIALSPKGDQFLVTPQLQGDMVALRLEWDGVKLEFEDADDVPLDEDAAQALGDYVNSRLALEWGESGAQVQLHYASYRERRTACYLKHRARGEVRA